jgi:hypothetical protein
MKNLDEKESDNDLIYPGNSERPVACEVCGNENPDTTETMEFGARCQVDGEGATN